MRLMWFRSDLRTADNIALYHATRDQEGVIGLYLCTPAQWRQHGHGVNKVDFLLRNLHSLQESLAALNIPLLVMNVADFSSCAEVVRSVVAQFSVTDVHVNDEYPVNERRRDAAVAAMLAGLGVRWHSHCDFILLPPGAVRTQSGDYFRVFTPFKRAWLQRVMEAGVPQAWSACRQPAMPVVPVPPLPGLEGYQGVPVARDAWPAGEKAAHARLKKFIVSHGDAYRQQRDLPGLDATSRLSPYLAAGVISCRECMRVALAHNHGQWTEGSPGLVAWLNELIWREFYSHIVVGFPHVSRNRNFIAASEAIAWRNDPRDIEAWQQGRTGIPLVDAAIRQMLGSGWMHNRLRMVAAMFLTKNLLVDWRVGEAFFMQHLVDGEFAANNGGWQWSASTGTDAAPYFRVFNPVEQAKKFDPDGAFIRQWVPELRHVQGADIFLPSPLVRQSQAPEYPAPIVDLAYSRQRAIAAFGAVLGKGGKH